MPSACFALQHAPHELGTREEESSWGRGSCRCRCRCDDRRAGRRQQQRSAERPQAAPEGCGGGPQAAEGPALSTNRAASEVFRVRCSASPHWHSGGPHTRSTSAGGEWAPRVIQQAEVEQGVKGCVAMSPRLLPRPTGSSCSRGSSSSSCSTSSGGDGGCRPALRQWWSKERAGLPSHKRSRDLVVEALAQPRSMQQLGALGARRRRGSLRGAHRRLSYRQTAGIRSSVGSPVQQVEMLHALCAQHTL
jgi:hypothetical protein